MRCLARADRTGLEKRGRGLEVAAKASAATDYSTPRRRRRRRRRCGRFTIHDECVKDAASDDGIFGIFVVVWARARRPRATAAAARAQGSAWRDCALNQTMFVRPSICLSLSRARHCTHTATSPCGWFSVVISRTMCASDLSLIAADNERRGVRQVGINESITVADCFRYISLCKLIKTL